MGRCPNTCPVGWGGVRWGPACVLSEGPVSVDRLRGPLQACWASDGGDHWAPTATALAEAAIASVDEDAGRLSAAPRSAGRRSAKAFRSMRSSARAFGSMATPATRAARRPAGSLRGARHHRHRRLLQRRRGPRHRRRHVLPSVTVVPSGRDGIKAREDSGPTTLPMCRLAASTQRS